MDHELARQQAERLGREVDLVQIGDLEPQLVRQRLDEVPLRDEPLAHEHVSQPATLDLLARESGLDLVLADQAVGDQQRAESPAAAGQLRTAGMFRLASTSHAPSCRRD